MGPPRRRPPASVAPEAHEALALALTRDDLEAEVGPLLERSGWRPLMQLLVRQRMLPLLGTRLRQRAGDALPPEAVGLIEAAVTDARRVGDAQRLLGDAVLERLRAAGIAATWVKGAGLAHALYGDAGLRQSGDIDLLVGPEALEPAAEVVAAMGWSRPRDWRDKAGWPLLHLSLGHPRGLPTVELHWRVHWYEDAFAAAALARAAPTAGGLELMESDRLAVILLCHARDGLAGLRLTADALACWSRLGNRPAPLACVMADHPALRPALGAAATAVARVAHRDPALLLGLGDDGLGPRARGAVALADPLLRMDHSQHMAERALVDVLLAPQRGVGAALRRQVLPPRDLLRLQLLPLESAGQGRLIAAGGEHTLRMLRRFGLAIVRRTRAPTALGSGELASERT